MMKDSIKLIKSKVNRSNYANKYLVQEYEVQSEEEMFGVNFIKPVTKRWFDIDLSRTEPVESAADVYQPDVLATL